MSATPNEAPPGSPKNRSGTSTVSARPSAEVVLEAMLSVASWAELEPALRRIVSIATTLVDARYGALGIVGPDHLLSRFVYVGIDSAEEAVIGPLPKGRGLLGHLIADPAPLRLHNLAGHPASIGFPPNHPPMRSFLGVPVTVDGRIYGSFYLCEKNDGTDFDTNDETTLVGLAAAVSVAVEQSRTFEKIRSRQSRLDAIEEVAGLLARNDTTAALRTVARWAMELTAADGAFIVQREPHHNGVELGVLVGLTEQQAIAIEAGAGDLPIAALLETDAPWLADLTAEPRGLNGIGPVVGVPLRSGGEAIGAIVALRKSGHDLFVAEDLPLLKMFADQASIVLKVASKNRAQARLDLVAEHYGVARGLYDMVIQQLFAAGLSLQSVVQGSEDPDIRRRLQETVEQLDRVAREIRVSIFDEVDSLIMEPASLRRQLRDTIAQLCHGTQIRPSVRVGGTVDTLVPAATADHAKAVVREAVGNIVRRPKVSVLDLQVEAQDHFVVAIEDDGDCSSEFANGGLVPSAAWLAKLVSRAEWCGGTCQVLPRPSSGTLIHWTVPLLPEAP